MPGFVDDAAARADRAVAGPRRDLAQLERELRRAGERVAALVHRRRARVRRLAAPGDPVALDAERAEHGPERQPERLEHRPLLDVQLEVGRRVLELRARLERAVELDAVLARARPAARSPSRSVSAPQVVLVRHRPRRRARAEQRAAEARALLVGPVDEPHGDRRRRPPPRSRRSTSTAATTLRQPSSQPPFGTESMWPPSRTRALGVAAQRPPLVAGLVDLVLERQPVELAAEPLLRPRPRVASRPRAGRRSRRPSARAARAARRRFGPGRAARGRL